MPKRDLVLPYNYIVPNFRGAQFSWTGVFKHFAETIFADQGSRILLASIRGIRYSKISRSLIFQVRCQSAINAKIMCLKNLALYSTSFINSLPRTLGTSFNIVLV